MTERIHDPEQQKNEASDAEKKAVQDWLDRKAPNLTCPACGQRGHAVKEVVLCPTPGVKKYWQVGDEMLRAVAVACNTCSYLWFFSTEFMNLP